jgi:tetratricopeptide (TPR) repeat protein
MFKNATYGLILLAATCLASGVAFADDAPTLDQVYQAAHAGKMDEAQGMMDKVLKEHPNSAKAHYVEAELLAKQGQMAKAGEELQRAERLKPDMSFATPQAVQDLRSRISGTHRVSQSSANPTYQPEPHSSFPWGMLFLGLGAIAVIVVIIRAMSARNPSAFPNGYQQGGNSPNPMQPYGGQPYGGPSYGGGMAPMGGAGGGIGSGIMGGLATGAAVGVGMVAGEALAHHFMDGGQSAPAGASSVADNWGNSSNSANNMGGSDFGIANNSSWDDSSNIADNNSGGGDWG